MFRENPPGPGNLVIVDLDALLPHNPDGDGLTYVPPRCRATQKKSSAPASQAPSEHLVQPDKQCSQGFPAAARGLSDSAASNGLEGGQGAEGAVPYQGNMETGNHLAQQNETPVFGKESPLNGNSQPRHTPGTSEGVQGSSRGTDSVCEACGRCMECIGFAVTPEFMPAGAVENRRLSPFVDVYAAGCILYLFMEGCLPHERPSAGR